MLFPKTQSLRDFTLSAPQLLRMGEFLGLEAEWNRRETQGED